MSDRETRFREVVERHGAALRRAVQSYARPGADQEDLMQDVLLAIWHALPHFRGEASEQTFVLRIGHYRGVTHLARRGLAGEPLAEFEDPTPSPETVTGDRREVERLYTALRHLPVPQRQVLTLSLEGLSHREIGHCLGTSAENVAVRLSRARAALRTAMEAHR